MKRICECFSLCERQTQGEMTDVIVRVELDRDIKPRIIDNKITYCMSLLRRAIEIDSTAGIISLFDRTIGLRVTKTDVIFLSSILAVHLYFAPSAIYTLCALGVVALISVLDRSALSGLRTFADALVNSISYDSIRAEIIAVISALMVFMSLSSLSFSLIPLALSALALELKTNGEYVIHSMSTYTALCMGVGTSITDMSFSLEIILRILTAGIVFCGLQATSEGLKRITG